MVFPVVMYGCESWTVKKVEHRRIDAFELWCWRKLLRVPWTARRSNQSILKEISPEYSLEWLMLKLKLQSFGHMIGRTDSLEKILILGKIKGRRRRGMTEDEVVGWHHQLDGHEFQQALGVGDGQGRLPCCSPWGCKESDMTEQLNWTEGIFTFSFCGTANQLCRWIAGFVICGCAKLLSRVWLFVTPWSVARQAPLSMRFSRQKHWSGLPCYLYANFHIIEWKY